VNPPEEVDRGRFVAVIQVAPSVPAEFITVALTRTAQGSLQIASV
jgi:phage tail sheath protein FI